MHSTRPLVALQGLVPGRRKHRWAQGAGAYGMVAMQIRDVAFQVMTATTVEEQFAPARKPGALHPLVARIRRVSGDPVRMESIFSFQALFPFQVGGVGGGSPRSFFI